MQIRNRLIELGADSRSIIELYQPSPAAVRYLDLIDNGPATAVVAIVEFGLRPLAYYVDYRDRRAAPSDHRNLLHRLACRGDHAYLVVDKKFHLNVTPVALGMKDILWRRIPADRPLLLQSLAIGGLGAFERTPEVASPPLADDGEQLNL